jgi:hypothetical protein
VPWSLKPKSASVKFVLVRLARPAVPDIAPCCAGHVVIFGRWTDATTRIYLGHEQSGDGGTHHQVIPYPTFGHYSMNPYRWPVS